MTNIFTTLVLSPIFNFTVFIYNLIGGDFGVAVIILTAIIRVVLFPLTMKITRSQIAMARLAPKLKEIKQKFKNDQVAQGNATMQLYKSEGVNPFSGCISMLIQLPIIIALYRTFTLMAESKGFEMLYGFIHNPGIINNMFLGVMSISGPSQVLAVVAGIAQYIQSRKLQELQKPGDDINPTQKAMNKQMLYFFPVMIIIISWKMPAALAIYWICTSLFSVLEQKLIQKKFA